MLNCHQYRQLLAATVVVLALTGCSRNDPATLVASAKVFLDKNDAPAAIIQLKNALQVAPESAEARFLLGKSLLESGDPGAAETELRKALDLKYSAEEAYPLLARALLQQGKYEKLISDVGDRKFTTPPAQAEVLTSLGLARLGLGEKKEAHASIDAALIAKPGDLHATVAQAQLAAMDNDLPRALKLVDQALSTAPDDLQALQLKADVQEAGGQHDDAIKTLGRALELRPNSIQPRLAMVSILARNGQVDRAAKELEPLTKSMPKDPRTLYAQALVAFERGDMTAARDAIQGVLSVAPDNLPSVYLSGLINFRLASYGAAEQALRTVVAKAPGDVGARQVLAATYMRTGRTTAALETLEPALQAAPDNPGLLRAAAEVYLASNDPGKAAQFYERANAIDKGSVEGRVRLAQVKLAAGGDADRALKDLESIASANPSSQAADLALISVHLRQHEIDKAMAAADSLVQKQPKNPLGYNIKGVIYSSKRDFKSARAAFDEAMKVDPDYPAAALNLARLDLMERNVDGARKIYEQMLVKDPHNEQALLALAGIAASTSSPPAQVKAAVERAVTANPTSVRAQLALIGYYSQRQDAKAALAAAQAADAAIPGNPQILDALGISQQVAGDNNQAIDTLTRAAKLQPQSATPLVRLAGVELALKDFNGAIDTLHKAIALQPQQSTGWLALATVYGVADRVDAGIADARKLQKEYPVRAIGYAMEGELLARQKKFDASATAYREALAREPLPLLSVRLYSALQAAGKTDQANVMAQRWQKEHPTDVLLQDFQGQQAVVAKDYRVAVQHFNAVIAVEPENTAALNNLAWTLNELGDRKALEYAERASALAPFAPAVMDTHGWILVQHGDAARGIALLQRAASLAPQNEDIQLHYAKAMLKSGDKSAAKGELAKLAAQTKASPARTEAQQLLKDL